MKTPLPLTALRRLPNTRASRSVAGFLILFFQKIVDGRPGVSGHGWRRGVGLVGTAAGVMIFLLFDRIAFPIPTLSTKEFVPGDSHVRKSECIQGQRYGVVEMAWM